jgi:GTPase involved in cell partitioning and DNA repair
MRQVEINLDARDRGRGRAALEEGAVEQVVRRLGGGGGRGGGVTLPADSDTNFLESRPNPSKSGQNLPQDRKMFQEKNRVTNSAAQLRRG